jgi:PBSX family phage portal protein
MSKRKQSRAKYRNEQMPADAVEHNTSGIEAFSFGDPEPIDRLALLDYMQVVYNGRWYDPPVMPKGLADLTRMSPHHSSAINVKRNLLVATFQPTSYLTVAEFSAFVTDYVTFGNAYFERIKAISGRLLRLKRSPAMFTRRGKEGAFWFVPYNDLPFAFELGSMVHLLDTDVTQEIYGVPEYIAALHAAMLNQSATLFRRRYYDNGSHAGFILYVSDPAQSPSDIDAMREALKKSKGPGNFRNLFMYSPNGKKDGIQLIPISEVAAKDDFAAIKNTSRDDILAAHRVPPQLLGVVPVNAGGFGDVDKASAVFMRNEIVPLQARLLGLNDELGVEAIRFKPTDPAASQSA